MGDYRVLCDIKDGILRVAAADVATGLAASTMIVHANRQVSPDAADAAVRAAPIE